MEYVPNADPPSPLQLLWAGPCRSEPGESRAIFKVDGRGGAPPGVNGIGVGIFEEHDFLSSLPGESRASIFFEMKI